MELKTLMKLSITCESLSSLAGAIREETNAVVATNDHIQIIKHYDKLRMANELIKESKEALRQLEEQLSRELVPDAMRRANVRNITIEDVGRVTLGTRWSAKMPDKEGGFDWLRSHGHGGIIIETVNAQTLGALAKELNADGVELPTPTFETSIMTYTSITKVKGKNT